MCVITHKFKYIEPKQKCTAMFIIFTGPYPHILENKNLQNTNDNFSNMPILLLIESSYHF